MALTALWVVALTADLSGAAAALRAAWGGPSVAAWALQAELGPLCLSENALGQLSPWQQLVVRQSPALYAGQGAVDRLLSRQEEPPPTSGGETEGEEPQPTATVQPEDTVPQTLGPSSGRSYDQAEGVYISNPTSQSVDVAALAAAPVEITLPKRGPRSSSSTPTAPRRTPPRGRRTPMSPPTPTAPWTPDTTWCGWGRRIARVLEEEGFSVLHDTTLYDYPSYNEAYDRSLAGAQALLEQYPSIRIVLDVHRDALEGEDGTVYKTMAQTGGEAAAQVMLVMGTDDNGLPHERWRDNLTLAVHLQMQLNQDCPTLARPISLRAGRYNQQLTTGSLLVEVGSHGNTLEEALAAARLFAQSAAEVFGTLW